MRPFLLLVSFLFASASMLLWQTLPAQGATRTWDGGGTDGTCGGAAGDGNKWSCALNWSLDTVPLAADIATFNSTSTKSATIDTSISVTNLRMLSGYTGTITQAAGVTITVGASGFEANSGIFNGGNSEIDVNGELSVIGGTFNSTTGNLKVRTFTVSSGAFNPSTGTVINDEAGNPWNVASTETFNNLTLDRASGNMTITSGDNLLVDGTLSLSNGGVNTGTLSANGPITQAATFDGGTAVVSFANDSSAQTYTLNGGITPLIILDSAADASDSLTFTAATTVSAINIQAGFSGTIPIVNSGNNLLTFTSWTQSAGTLNASAQSSWVLDTVSISGGSFTAPTLITTSGVGTTWDVNSSLTVNQLTIAKTSAQTWTIASGDTIVTTGLLTLTDGLAATGTMSAQGSVTIGGGWDGGTSPLTFTGSATQTFTLTTGFAQFNGDISVNKTGGQVNLATRLIMDAASQDLIIQEGTFNVNGQLMSVNGTGSTLVVEDGGNFMHQGAETFTFNAGLPTLNTGSTVTFTGDGDGAVDTYTVTTLKTTYHHLTIANAGGTIDTYQLGAPIDINGNFTNTAGNFNVSASSHAMTVAGNWSNTGGFNAQSGTVTLDGAGQTIAGTTTFRNFTKTPAGIQTLTFPASLTQTFTGTLTLTSLLLRSSIPGTKAKIDPQGARSVSVLDVQDNDNDNATIMNCTPSCVDSGNNENWFTAAGVTVSAISGNTTEAGGTATFTVVLDSQPSGNVEIDSVSNDATEGVVTGGGTLTFTNITWATPQTVTVTGQNDDVDDGNILYSIVVDTDDANTADAAYDAFDPADVAVTNTDNDTAGVTVSAISGNTTEAGGTATFTVVLDSEPTGNVEVDSVSSDATEGVVTGGGTLTFTNITWATPQTVTVTGQNDDVDDGNILYSIVVTTDDANTADPLYDPVDPADVAVTNTDNDTAGVTVSAISGNTTEAGGTATFTVVLDTEPTGNVQVDSVSADATEGVVTGGGTLTFTNITWATPQTVTVTGQNDDIDDGDVFYSITVTTNDTATADPLYDPVDPADVGVNNTDNDTVGVTVTPISGNTTEAGGTATFTVVLNTEPTGNVQVDSVSSDATEGVVTSGGTLTFTTADWDDPQTVTVTGQNDDVDDGNILYSIVVTTNDAATADPLYDPVDPADVAVTNTDNDTVGVTVSAISGNTTEAGGTATFTVVLDTEPVGVVEVDSVSSDATEGVVTGGGTLTFTNITWATPQTVTVTGQDDLLTDGNIAYSIVVTTDDANTTDPLYDPVDPADVAVTNTDNDMVGVTVSAISGNTTEAGGTATFTVVLNTVPAGSVEIDSVSTDATEGVVTGGGTLTFTALDWNVPKTVTVTGQNDDVDDGNILYSIDVSTDDANTTDPLYDAVDPSDVAVTNTDNDTAGVTVSAISGNTTEAGGTATFTVVLDSEPTGNVEVDSVSNNATEGVVTGGATLTFTNITWATPQTVTVTGQNDDIDDGDILYSIVVSTDDANTADPLYDAVDPADVAVTNTDNDTAGVTVSPISGNTTEAGGTATFTVVLNTEPVANVVVDSVSSDGTEGIVTGGASLLFTSVDWFTPQTVTVTGQNDDIDDGDILYSIVVTTNDGLTTDPTYDPVDPADVAVTNTDNDTAGVTVSAISGNTTESGGTATFTVVLNTEPTGNVEVDSVSSDATEGVVTGGATLTFTNITWATPQTVTVTGQDDAIDDGDILYSIVVSTDDANTADVIYDAVDPADVAVTNVDNDTVGVTVSAISGNTTEAGGTATFTVVLNTQPTGNVEVDSVSNDATEGVVTGGATLTFTTADWDDPQTVTVTGQDDAIDDGDILYSIVVSTDDANTADPAYDAVDPNDVAVTNTDNDAAGVTVSAISGNTTEAGGTATFTVVLTSQPTGNVEVDSVSNDATEGVVTGGATRTFTTLDWFTPQTVTVTGQNDDVDDGDILYSIVVSTDDANTADPAYDAVDPNDVAVTNTDNDTVGVTVSAISGNTTETGGTATFTVVLNSEPTGNVEVDSVSSDATEGIVTTNSTLTFTNITWATPQTVTVTGQDDALTDGDILYSIVVTTDDANTADPLYDAVDPNDVTVTNDDDEVSGVTVSAISGNTTEAGGTATFTVVLDSQPIGNVEIDSVSSDATEGIVTGGATLTFTNITWATPQTVTVTGQNDDIDDGDILYSIVVTTDDANTADPVYDAVDPADVAVTNVDNDTVGITVSAISGNTTEAGGTATFTVVLNTQPTGNVEVDSVSSDATEGVVTGGGTLTFTTLDWSTPKTVTVTGQNDDLDDGDIAYSIVVDTDDANTADVAYDAVDPNDVAVTNLDNDAVGVTIAESAGSTNVNEAGETTDTYTVVLDTQPSDTVTITIVDGPDASAAPTPLVFTTGNWDDPQTITVTAIDDALDETNPHTQNITHSASSPDLAYDGIAIDDVMVNVADDDTSAITVSAISGNTTEVGGTATFTVVLETMPSADVVIDLNSDDFSEGTVDLTQLTFTSADWDDPQTVTVTGQDDDVDDGDVLFHIVLDPAVSLDPTYSGANPADVDVVNVDDDTAGITVVESGGSTAVAEAGATTDTFTIVLDSEPTDDVTITVSDDADADASPAILAFTSGNWDTPQTVTVQAVDDVINESDPHTSTVSFDVSSLDLIYDGFGLADVLVDVADDDVGGGGGGGGGSTPVTPPSREASHLSIEIDGGAATTPDAQVTVTVSADDAESFQLSNSTDFNGAIWQAYDGAPRNVPWTLDRSAGFTTVYVRFRSIDGVVSDFVSDTIEVVPGSEEPVPPEEVEPDGTVGEIMRFIRTRDDSTVYAEIVGSPLRPFVNLSTYLTYADFCENYAFVDPSFIEGHEVDGLFPVAPGRTLVKFPTGPEVYVVEKDPTRSFGRVLRWIVSEDVAVENFGPTWNRYVIDVSSQAEGYVFGPSVQTRVYDGTPGTLRSRAALNAHVTAEPYIVRPDGEVRRGYSLFAKTETDPDGVTSFQFEDSTDFDYNDVRIQLDPTNCLTFEVGVVPTDATIRHQVWMTVSWDGVPIKDVLLFEDSKLAEGKAVTVDVANESRMQVVSTRGGFVPRSHLFNMVTAAASYANKLIRSIR